MADELSESISSVYAKLVKIILTDSNAMKDYEKNMTSGNVEKDVEYLKELIDGIYPQIPEQSIQYVTIPDAVAEDFSPAAYMISAFDDPTRNVVLLNPTAEDDRGIFTKLNISAASTDCPFRSSCARPRAIPRDGLFSRSFLFQVSAKNTEWAAARCGNTKVCLQTFLFLHM